MIRSLLRFFEAMGLNIDVVALCFVIGGSVVLAIIATLCALRKYPRQTMAAPGVLMIVIGGGYLVKALKVDLVFAAGVMAVIAVLALFSLLVSMSFSHKQNARHRKHEERESVRHFLTTVWHAMREAGSRQEPSDAFADDYKTCVLPTTTGR